MFNSSPRPAPSPVKEKEVESQWIQPFGSFVGHSLNMNFVFISDLRIDDPVAQ